MKTQCDCARFDFVMLVGAGCVFVGLLQLLAIFCGGNQVVHKSSKHEPTVRAKKNPYAPPPKANAREVVMDVDLTLEVEEETPEMKVLTPQPAAVVSSSSPKDDDIDPNMPAWMRG